MKSCKSCGSTLPPRRIELGYRVCVACSTEERWSGVPVVNHKTGNEIQIVKDPDVAADFLAKSARVGFGTLRGMTSSRKPRKAVTPREVKIEEKPVHSYELSRRALPHEFDAVCQEALDLLERAGSGLALSHVEEALEQKRIYRVHAKQICEILLTFAGQTIS